MTRAMAGNGEAERRERLFSRVPQDAILLFGHARSLGTGTQSFANFRYFLGVDTGSAWCLAVLLRGQVPVVLSSNYFLVADLIPQSLGYDIRFVEVDRIGSAVAELIRDVPGEIGLLGAPEMPLQLWRSLTAAIPAERLQFQEKVAATLRLCADDTQLSAQRQAARLVDDLFSLVSDLARRALPGWRIQRALEGFALDEGADQCWTWLTTAPEADFCHSAKELAKRVPAQGDQLLLGVMLTVDGAWGHGIRTYHLGPVPDSVQSLFEGVSDVRAAALAALRPGADLARLDALIETRYRSRFSDVLGRAKRFRTMHGLGLSYEEPLTSPFFHQPFAASTVPSPGLQILSGMVFELHPNLFVPGLGGVAVGDMVLVTDSGNEILTNHPRDIHVI